MKKWRAKFVADTFNWNFASGLDPISDRSIQLQAVTVPDVAAEEGDENVLNNPEFQQEITVQTKALDSLEEAAAAGDLENFDAANAGFTIIKTTDATGMFVG